jgi:hypothetical protein
MFAKPPEGGCHSLLQQASLIQPLDLSNGVVAQRDMPEQLLFLRRY